MAGKSGVSINWGGFDRAMGNAVSNIGDTQGLMLKIGKAMAGHTAKRFRTGTGPSGEAWKSVKYPRKDSKGRPQKGRAAPLDNTGHLKRSISVSATPTEVHVGSNVEYARIHQLGGQAGRGRKVTIPARPYLGLSGEDREEITYLVQEHLKGAFK